MKKLIITSILLFSLLRVVYSYGATDRPMEWTEYELYCEKNDIECNYEDYVQLSENPQCLIVDDYDECNQLFIHSEDL